MTSLTQAQIDELDAIANSGQSGARVAYYTKLAEFGVTYGSLALGVVLEDQISGRVANAYFMAVAEQEGVSVSPQQWAAIGDALMLADFQARQNAKEVGTDGTVSYSDLGYQSIRDYHALVFSSLGGTVPEGEGVSINGWTAFAPVETYGLSKWDEMLTASQWGQTASGVWTLMQMAWHAKNAADPLAIQWASMIALPAFEAGLAGGSPAAFADEINNAHIILGTLSGDMLSISSDVPNLDTVLVMGLGGADTIQTRGSNDFYDGGSGDDTFTSSIGGDRIFGGDGFDTIDYSSASSGISVIGSSSLLQVGTSGKAGDRVETVESLFATSHADHFTFLGSPALLDLQHIDAGAGIDTLSFGGSNEGLLINLEQGQLTGLVTGAQIAIENFENATAGAANDAVIGSSAANMLRGGMGSDTLQGLDGDDTLWGDAGDDFLFGDAGDDQMFGGDGNDNLTGGVGNDKIWGDNGNDRLEGGAGDDRLVGGAGDDHLYGGDGNDNLIGDAGDNFLFGEDGDDIITCYGGNDIALGGQGADWFYLIGAVSTLTITDFELGVDQFIADSPLAGYSDTSNGLQCEFDGGGLAIFHGITAAQADGWLI